MAKNKNSRKRQLRLILGIIFGAILLCIVGFIAFITLLAYALSGLGDFMPRAGNIDCGGDTFTNESIEQWANLEIPESATNVVTYSIAHMDCEVYISFEMDSDELDTFLASTDIELPLQVASESQFSVSQFQNLLPAIEWEITPTNNFLVGDGASGLRDAQYIAIDISDPQHYIVYIIRLLL